MHTAELRFRRSTSSRGAARGEPDSAADDAIEAFLLALERNGQLIPDASRPDVRIGDECRVFALIPERTSLARARHSPRVRDAIARLRECGVARPTMRVIGWTPASAAVCRCPRPAAFVLWTNGQTCELPLRCWTCAGVFPFYRFEHTGERGTYEDVIFWLFRYRVFDDLWMASRSGERLAYRELSRHDSELSREGREVCRAIERRARVPVYYYLMRYHGRSEAAERRRRCPSCRKPWLLPEPWRGKLHFRCRRCRLASNVAFDVLKL